LDDYSVKIYSLLGGKSEHRRTGSLVIQGIRKDMESAAENKPPKNI